MMSIPQYLLESSFCLALFYIFYWLWLRKETFFQANRFYLLLTPLLSLVIPLLNIKLRKPDASQALDMFYPVIYQADNFNQLIFRQIYQPTPAFSLTIGDMLMMIYLLGAMLMLGILCRGLWRLFRIIKKSRRENVAGYQTLNTEGELPAASFFSYIFWNNEPLTAEKRWILEHEMVHIRQWHSLDVLLMEAWVIIKWFNPLIYLYRKSLQATHEYIADEYMVEKTGSAYDYAQFLVQNHPSTCHPLTNTFAAMIKKRLVMLSTDASQNWRSIKYLMSLPILALLMSLFSFNLVDELPDSVLQSFNQAEHYINDLTDKTVLTIPSETDAPYYIEWNGTTFPAHWVNGGEFTTPLKDFINLEALQEMAKTKPRLVVNGKIPKIKTAVLIVQNGTDWVKKCEFNWSNEEDDCVLNRLSEIREEGRVILLLKTTKDKLFEVGLITQKVKNPATWFEEDKMLNDIYWETFSELSFRVLQSIETPRPVFNPQAHFKLKWGNVIIPIQKILDTDIQRASATITFEELERMLDGELDFLIYEKTVPIQSIILSNLSSLKENKEINITKTPTVCVNSNHGDEETDSEISDLANLFKLAAFKQAFLEEPEETKETILKKVKEGYSDLVFNFSIDEDGFNNVEIRLHIKKTKETNVLTQTTVKETPYHLQWGNSFIPIEKIANPNSWEATISVSLEQLRFMLQEKFVLYKQQNKLDILEISLGTPLRYFEKGDKISEEEFNLFNQLYFIKDKNDKIKSDYATRLLNVLNKDFIDFSFSFHMKEEASLNFFTLKIDLNQPDPLWTPNSHKKISLSESIANFQFVTLRNQRNIIKMDTTNQQYRWMYEQYKDGDQLEVIHIPNFKTARRVITLDDEIIREDKIEKNEVLSTKYDNIHIYPEYHTFFDSKVLLRWRNHYGTNETEKYNLADFQAATKDELVLSVDDEKLTVKQVELIFVTPDDKALKFITDDVDRPEIQYAIAKMQPRTSLYLTHLLVEDEQGKLLHFPVTFVFNLE